MISLHKVVNNWSLHVVPEAIGLLLLHVLQDGIILLTECIVIVLLELGPFTLLLFLLLLLSKILELLRHGTLLQE